MNEEIKEKIEFLKNIVKKDITWNGLPEKYLEEIEEYINNLVYIINTANMMEYFKGLDKDGSFNNI